MSRYSITAEYGASFISGNGPIGGARIETGEARLAGDYCLNRRITIGARASYPLEHFAADYDFDKYEVEGTIEYSPLQGFASIWATARRIDTQFSTQSGTDVCTIFTGGSESNCANAGLPPAGADNADVVYQYAAGGVKVQGRLGESRFRFLSRAGLGYGSIDSNYNFNSGLAEDSLNQNRVTGNWLFSDLSGGIEVDIRKKRVTNNYGAVFLMEYRMVRNPGSKFETNIDSIGFGVKSQF